MITSLKKLVGIDERRLKKYYKLVSEINALEPEIEKLSDQQLKEKTEYFKDQLKNGKTVLELQVEAFAVVREAAKRVLGMRPYDVQLIGGLAMIEGNISEMATGEGKTLVAALPSYLRAIEGKGVHVITVNEYLAKRDRELNGQIHEFLGLKVGLNLPMMDVDEKQQAYQADITYGIGSEFGFDYLRDNMVYHPSQRVQRPYHFAIIDEVDSVLIDEAKTPLIIAGKTDVKSHFTYLCARVVKNFVEEVDFEFDNETKATSLTEEGIRKVEAGFGIENLYDPEHQTLYHYIIQALRAMVQFERDVDYIVKDGKVLLVDIFTGRPMEGRSLSNGLHQAIEAKEGLEITEENRTQASITIQNYFRMYPILSGMTGTAKTEEKEFQETYNMDVVRIPTNKPKLRADLPDRVFVSIPAKYKAVAKKVKELHKHGQPVLIGTSSILQSEQVGKYLKEESIPFQLLNAKSIEQEVEVIALAGQKGNITIATNMAGRGTDISLGEGVKELGGLYVIGTERHESRRVDNQLKGRSGRQGDPGTSEFFISLEDEMFRRFAYEDAEKYLASVKKDESGQILNKNIDDFVDKVQRTCESSNYGIRDYNLKLDDTLNIQRNTIYGLRNKLMEAEDILPTIKTMISSYIKEEFESCCSSQVPEDEWSYNKLQDNLNLVVPEAHFQFANAELERKEIEHQIEAALEIYLPHLDSLSIDEIQNIRSNMISIIDYHWLHHMDTMDRLREGIGLRSYSQEDPMRIYQREGLETFTSMYFLLERDSSRKIAEIVQINKLQ